MTAHRIGSRGSAPRAYESDTLPGMSKAVARTSKDAPEQARRKTHIRHDRLPPV